MPPTAPPASPSASARCTARVRPTVVIARVSCIGAGRSGRAKTVPAERMSRIRGKPIRRKDGRLRTPITTQPVLCELRRGVQKCLCVLSLLLCVPEKCVGLTNEPRL